MHCCHFCNVFFLTLNIVARKLMSAEGLFLFCRAALRGSMLELCRWSKCQSYVLQTVTHYILISILVSISIISWFRLINQIRPYWNCISGNHERYGLKTAGWGILSNAVKKYCSQFLIGPTIFLTREKRRSLFWLARTYFRTKIYDIAF